MAKKMTEWRSKDKSLHLLHGDCVKLLKTMPSASVDCVITDPPYPEVNRDYGRMSEADWHKMMDAVVPECRRVLKKTGSAMFVLQPNSERVGRMRSWLWEFMSKWSREWNQIQDMWSWNPAAMPTVHCNVGNDLTRPSVRALIWLGPPKCYKNQTAVLWTPSDAIKSEDWERRRKNTPAGGHQHPSGHGRFYGQKWKEQLDKRGGTTPFNLLPISNTNSHESAGAYGHGAGTPGLLCDWWLRYICPEKGICLDPFAGSASVGVEAVKQGKQYIGIEKEQKYFKVAIKRLSKARNQHLRPMFNKTMLRRSDEED